MLATALPPVLAAPAAVPAPSPAASGGSGNDPESFARMLDAADACRQAPDTKPGQKAAAEKKGADKMAAAKLDIAALAVDAATVDSEPAQADSEAAETGTASTVVEAFDPGLLPNPSQATPAAALLAGLTALPRPATAEPAATDSATLGARPAVRRAGDAIDATATGIPPRPAAQALETPGAAPRALGGAAMAGGGTDTGHRRDPLPALIQQVRADAGQPARATSALDTTGSAPRPLGDGATAGGSLDTRHGRDPSPALIQQVHTDAGPPDDATRTGTSGLQTVAAPAAEIQPSTGIDSLTLGAAPLTVAAGPGTPSISATPTVTPARLSASPGSPEFAGQLGAQLTTFVREGVQHARLELHPIELGPVTVQIAIDGSQARVNLAAEHAATRQALEQAMPALAGSLREAGLTLSGGGVFEQPRQPQPDGGAAASGGRDSGQRRSAGDERPGSPADRDTAALDAAPLRRRGVVDLVA